MSILSVPYPDKPRQKCGLLITDDGDTLFFESKLLRILGDNGKPNVHSRTARLKPGRIRLRYLSFAPLHAAVHRLPDPSWNGRGGKRLGCGAARALSGLPRLARALQVFVVAYLIDARVIALLALVRLAD